MSKTKEELNQLKIEYEALNMKLAELTEEELKQVTGGDLEFGFIDVSACPIADTCPQDPAQCNLHVGNNRGAFKFCPKI